MPRYEAFYLIFLVVIISAYALGRIMAHLDAIDDRYPEISLTLTKTELLLRQLVGKAFIAGSFLVGSSAWLISSVMPLLSTTIRDSGGG